MVQLRLRLTAFLAAILLSQSAFCAPGPGSDFVEVPGGPVWYKVVGEGGGLPVLFLHGGPGGTSCGFSMLDSLGSERPLVRYDQLGTGRSARPEDPSLWTVERFVEGLHQVRLQLGLDSFHLVGQSWGGALAAAYLLEKGTEGVASVTFSSPLLSTPEWIEDANLLRARLPVEVRNVLDEHEAAGTLDSPEYAEATRVFYQRHVFGTESLPELEACYGAPWNEALYNHMWGPTEFVSTGTLKDFDVTSELHRIDIPTLFLAGEHDEARPETVKRLSSRVPGARFEVIKGAAHATFRTQPAQYMEILEAFLDSVEAGSL